MSNTPDKDWNFRSAIVRGVSWSTAATVITQSTTFLTFGILAKFFLTPADFGLVAMITVLTGFAGLFTDFGLGAALIQNPNIRESHKSSIFWLGVTTGAVLAITISLFSSAIGDFYEKPALQPMVAPLALTLLLGSLSSVHLSLLRKDLDFKSVAIVSIIADLSSAVIAIAAAAGGAGAWALVLKILSLQIVFLVGSWAFSKWRPRFEFCTASVREVIGFGASFFSARMLVYITGKLGELVVGKFAGDSALGIYSNACKIVLAPVGVIKNQTLAIFFPAFSTIQHDLPRVRKITLKLSGLLALVGFPVLFFIVVASSSFVDCFLSKAWDDMKLALVLLSFVAMFEISIFPNVIFLSQGKPSQYFKLMLGTKTISVIGTIVGVATYGITGMLVGMLAAAAINFLPSVILSARVIQLEAKRQLVVNSLPFGLSVVAACIVIAADTFLMSGTSPIVRLLLQSIVFFGVLGCLGWMLRSHLPVKGLFKVA